VVDGPARSVANRLVDGKEDLTGMRGPYLQALDIPNWSDRSWDAFARSAQLEPHIRRAFTKIGFERLYDFQERSIEAILDGDDTVITAATGRGRLRLGLFRSSTAFSKTSATAMQAMTRPSKRHSSTRRRHLHRIS